MVAPPGPVQNGALGASVPSRSVRTTCPETQALPEAKARLTLEDGTLYLPSVWSDGTFSLGPLARVLSNVVPGRFTLTVEGGVSRAVEVVEGQRTTVAPP